VEEAHLVIVKSCVHDTGRRLGGLTDIAAKKHRQTSLDALEIMYELSMRTSYMAEQANLNDSVLQFFNLSVDVYLNINWLQHYLH
jgi:hypothetical protein